MATDTFGIAAPRQNHLFCRWPFDMLAHLWSADSRHSRMTATGPAADGAAKDRL